MKNIFITGGAGYIGSHCAAVLLENSYNPIILDNFSNSEISTIKKLEKISKKKITFYNIDIKDKKKLLKIFDRHNCDQVIHCAGLKVVEESIKKPIKYFDNNISLTLSLLECMQKKNIFRLIFSSSASVYDHNQNMPLNENSKIGNTTNSYATSKYIIEKILMDLSNFDKRWKIMIARYFNPISIHSSGLLKEKSNKVPSNLIPSIIKVVNKKLPFLKIFGKDYPTKDGTCIRDFIHIMDLANAHLAMIKNNNKKNSKLKIYNFGTGKGSSVLEIVKLFEQNLGLTIPLKFMKNREGDPIVSYCNPNKAKKELNWKSQFNLKDAVIDIKKNLSIKNKKI